MCALSRPLINLVHLAVSLGILTSSLYGQGTANPDAKVIKQRISAALTDSWKITGFESVNSPPGPWVPMFGDEYLGYVVTCEDLSKSVEDAGGKAGASASALRHPMFSVWLFRRSGSVTPSRVQQDWQKLRSSPIQRALPTLLGFNKDFVVACVYDCSEKMVGNVVTALKLQSFSSNDG